MRIDELLTGGKSSLLTTGQAARVKGVSVPAIHAARKRGVLTGRYVSVNGKKGFWLIEDNDKFQAWQPILSAADRARHAGRAYVAGGR